MFSKIITFCQQPLTPFCGYVGFIFIGLYISYVIYEIIAIKVREKRERKNNND